MAFSSSFWLHTTVIVAAASNTGFTVSIICFAYNYAGEEEAVKVLEMEEAEKMEKSLSKKVQDTVKGLRESLGGMKTPTKVNISIPSLQKSAAGCGSDVNLPTASAVSFMEGDTEPVDSVVPVGAVKAVFTATTPVQPGLKRKDQFFFCYT